LLVLVSAYILFGGHPAINQQSAHERLKQWNHALVLREELSGFRPNIGYDDIQITGWGYDRQAEISQPKLTWHFSQTDWTVKAEHARLKLDKINPKRFTLMIAGPLRVIKNGHDFAKITSTDNFIYIYNDTGKENLHSIHQQFITPKEMIVDFFDANHSDLIIKHVSGGSFLKLDLMPNIGKSTLSIRAAAVEVFHGTKPEPNLAIESWQLNLLENTASDHSRLGHVTLSARLKTAGPETVKEVEGTAEYKADRLYSHVNLSIQKLYAKQDGHDATLTGSIELNKDGLIGSRLKILPSKKVMTDHPLDAIINLLEP